MFDAIFRCSSGSRDLAITKTIMPWHVPIAWDLGEALGGFLALALIHDRTAVPVWSRAQVSFVHISSSDLCHPLTDWSVRCSWATPLPVLLELGSLTPNEYIPTLAMGVAVGRYKVLRANERLCLFPVW